MRARRVLCLMAMAAAVFLTQSCVAILGLDEKNTDAVDRLCQCDKPRAVFGDSKAACVAEVGHRLEAATSDTRAHWMSYFSSHFTDCNQGLDCLGQRPTCQQLDEKCLSDGSAAECCSRQCVAGKCTK